jgi:pectinesterase
MFEIHVRKEGGDYSTITEAIQAVPYNEEAIIYIGKGSFREKLFSEKKNITFIGEGIDSTIIEYADGAFDDFGDGSKYGTFRTYTAFFGGEKSTIKNMTISNTVGDGTEHGQALAVYADADVCIFENVKLTGHQDTLFCAPLPLTERQKNGFMGPRVLAPRKLTRQYYKNCEIYGDVDFIFGGADAVFDDCLIQCNNRLKVAEKDNEKGPESDRSVNGYITAASGLSENLGMVFRNCTIRGEKGCERGSVFLGRPWREQAKTVFLNCRMDDTIAPERFSGWGGITKDEPETFYGEYGTVNLEDGSDIDISKKNKWIRELDYTAYKEIDAIAEVICEMVK